MRGYLPRDTQLYSDRTGLRSRQPVRRNNPFYCASSHPNHHHPRLEGKHIISCVLKVHVCLWNCVHVCLWNCVHACLWNCVHVCLWASDSRAQSRVNCQDHRCLPAHKDRNTGAQGFGCSSLPTNLGSFSAVFRNQLVWRLRFHRGHLEKPHY